MHRNYQWRKTVLLLFLFVSENVIFYEQCLWDILVCHVTGVSPPPPPPINQFRNVFKLMDVYSAKAYIVISHFIHLRLSI